MGFRYAGGMDALQREIVELKQRVERLEQMVGELAGRPLTPMAPSPSPLEAEIRELLAEGLELNAIKLYRERTNCSLWEAKTRVQALK